MAKKKTKAVRPKKGKAASRHQPVSRRPKTPALPGLEDMAAVASLDRICSSLADIRFQLNEARQQEKERAVDAIRELRKHGRTAYKSHGIELVRVAGDEKVRVRLVAGSGAADVEGDESEAADTGADA